MSSTTIKISAEAKEILDREAKKWCRSVKGQANYLIHLGLYVQDNEPDIARKAMESSNGTKKRTRKTS